MIPTARAKQLAPGTTLAWAINPDTTFLVSRVETRGTTVTAFGTWLHPSRPGGESGTVTSHWAAKGLTFADMTELGYVPPPAPPVETLPTTVHLAKYPGLFDSGRWRWAQTAGTRCGRRLRLELADGTKRIVATLEDGVTCPACRKDVEEFEAAFKAFEQTSKGGDA